MKLTFNFAHRLCGLENQAGLHRDGLSLLHDVWGLTWRDSKAMGVNGGGGGGLESTGSIFAHVTGS